MTVARERNTPNAIEDYSVPWASSLPSLLDNVHYRIEGPYERSSTRRWLGIISSHAAKFGYASQEWQSALQSSMQLAKQQNWGILFARSTPYAQIIAHAVRALRLPSLSIVFENEPECPSRDDPSGLHGRLTLIQDDFAPAGNAPLHDRAVAYMSEYLFAVEIRSGGKVEKLVVDRLQRNDIPSATTYVAGHFKATGENRTYKRLLDEGAIGWFSSTSVKDTRGSSVSCILEAMFTRRCLLAMPRPTFQPIVPLGLIPSSNKYLTHCTRARRGPWPDQSLGQFHDELIQNAWSQLPHPLETLVRILTQQRLIATKNFRQGNLDTVCFSEQPIDQLLGMRRFQSHLSRWDWEAYGIMIDRDWMAAQGARPVTYLNRDQANHRSAEERAFSQVISNKPNSQDWRNEKEWRYSGDLRLHQVPFSKGIVFVPSMAEAEAIAAISRWPVAVVNGARRCSS
ncbi:MAG: hypothetical protein ABL921_23860 [Pirellula sp.]